MTIAKYIKSQLSRFVDRFKDLKISYYKNSISGTNVLLCERNLGINEEIEDFQADLLFDFIDEFPSESLQFLQELNASRKYTLIYQEVGSEYTEFNWWSSFVANTFESDIKVTSKTKCVVVELSQDYLYALAA